MSPLRRFFRSIPTLITAFMMAAGVWVLAVSAADPTEEHAFPRAIPIEIVGQDPGLLLTGSLPEQLSLTLSAPRTVWEGLLREQMPIRAVLDLSGKGAGEHDLPVQVQINLRPIKIIDYSPRQVKIALESITSREFKISLKSTGEVAVGFEAGAPVLNQTRVTVTGPESIVNKVAAIRASYDMKDARENITQNLTLAAVDSGAGVVNGLTITPVNVTVTQEIKQRGGFRNVVVKAILNGQVARGYRVTNISVNPPAVTVFSSDPNLVNNLPGFIETVPLDLSNVKENLEKPLALNLPVGIKLVGDQTVDLQVSVSAIESSMTLNNMPVTIIGLDSKYQAHISPASVDVIFSGPLPALDALTMRDVTVVIDLSDAVIGTTQRIAMVEMNIDDLRVQTILPATVEVTISPAGAVESSNTNQPVETPVVTPTIPKGP